MRSLSIDRIIVARDSIFVNVLVANALFGHEAGAFNFIRILDERALAIEYGLVTRRGESD